MRCDGAKGAPRNEDGRVLWGVWSILEIWEKRIVDGELPVLIGAHLLLNLVDLP